MNQTKKNGKWKRKMEPYAFLVPLVLILFLFLDITGLSADTDRESGDHEFSILLCDQTITKRTLFCRA